MNKALYTRIYTNEKNTKHLNWPILTYMVPDIIVTVVVVDKNVLLPYTAILYHTKYNIAQFIY